MDGRREQVFLQKLAADKISGVDSTIKGSLLLVTYWIFSLSLKGLNVSVHPAKRSISFNSRERLAGNSNSEASQREKYSIPIGREERADPTGPFKKQP